MKSYLLEPTDVLFFRDGRPMGGSLSGNGAAWPLPHTLSASFHAALHRAEFSDISPHRHRPGRSGKVFSEDREAEGRRFGGLTCAGPFPVSPEDQWFVPTPRDLLRTDSLTPDLRPSTEVSSAFSSLPAPLRYGVVNQQPPSKESTPAWMSARAMEAYLRGAPVPPAGPHFHNDEDIFLSQSSIGIGIDPVTTSQDKERFYSAHYLRLRPGWRIGQAATCPDKGLRRGDLLEHLFTAEGHLIAGGQRRTCSVTPVADGPPLPRGMDEGWATDQSGSSPAYLLKWILLSPAVFPAITADADRSLNAHPGGWLPNWIDPDSGKVLLRDSRSQPRRQGENRRAFRERVRRECPPVKARLISAVVGKSIPITGWSLTGHSTGPRKDKAGAKSTHLAVPAGSVYYFAADSAEEATRLARLLNWHGLPDHPFPVNRRSTLAGEKGFGLGVCGTTSMAGPVR